MKSGQLILIGTLFVIIMGIVMVSLVGNFGSPTGGSQDVRARAAQEKGVRVSGVVSEVNDTEGKLVVGGVKFSSESSGEAKDTNDLGTWTITVPAGFNSATTPVGTTVIIGLDPKTFDARTHTATAKTIKPQAR